VIFFIRCDIEVDNDIDDNKDVSKLETRDEKAPKVSYESERHIEALKTHACRTLHML